MSDVVAAHEARGVESLLLLSVVPAYNEQEVLGEFHRRLVAVLAAMDCDAEIV